MKNLKKYLAEVIGTCVLTFAACGVAVVANLGDSWWVATSFAFGLVIVAMAYSIGNISGCHINPAVTVAMMIRKKIGLVEGLFYILSQVIGAFLGSLLLALCLRGNFEALGGNQIQPLLLNGGELDAWSYISAFLAEVLLTFIFVIAICGVTDDKYHDGKHAGIVIGLVLALVHLLGLGLTGTSVNPARSLAPAVLQAIAGKTESLQQVWIWILAPLAGGALAALVYNLVIAKKEAKEEPKAE